MVNIEIPSKNLPPSPIRMPSSSRLQERFETANCPICDGFSYQAFRKAQDDLTGKPGIFTFVRCDECGHHYQNPRIKLGHIGEYYDDEYISHRKQWGWFGKLVQWAFGKHDRDKTSLVRRYKPLDASSAVLDIGCARATFLQELNRQTQAQATGIDFKDLPEKALQKQIRFFKGLLCEAKLKPQSFDLITMWHYLEHCYEPMTSLKTCHALLKDDGRIVIEVPCLDSVTFALFQSRWPGLQAPQHTSLFNKQSLAEALEKSGFEIVAHLNYGAFPRFFYYFTGFLFQFTKGRGINLQKNVLPYVVGSVLFYPFIKSTERWISHSMQTVVCRKSRG